MQKLAQIRDEALANGNYPAAVAAETKRGQAAGLYIDRKEILHGKIDQMSREEVVREIRRLQEEFPALGSVIEGNIVVEEDEEKAD